MRLSKKTVLITIALFVGVLVLLYWGIRLSLPPIKQGPAIVTASDILGEPSEEYKEVMAKYKNGGTPSLEEQKIMQKEEIRGLEQFDSTAAVYAREMLEQGYLEASKNQYLWQKRKEFSDWMTNEMDRYVERKQSGDTTTTLE